MHQELNVLNDLGKVFPDIEGELCSRHSILLGKLKNIYAKIYDRTTTHTQIWNLPTTPSFKECLISIRIKTSTSPWLSKTV